MKPIIGINLDVKDGPPPEASVQTTYVDSVVKSGGIPVLIPPMPESDLNDVLEKLNGIIFVGGRDYNPERYNQKLDEATVLINERRDQFDFQFIDKVMQNKSCPVLGICLGAQLLNVYLGGNLHQDIPKVYPESQIEHASPDGWENGFKEHSVKINAGSKLADIFKKEEIIVSTSHHQSIEKVGEGLEVVSLAPDGVIEAVEMKDRRFVIGVQWHPERGYDINKPLFDEFVKCSAQSNGKH